MCTCPPLFDSCYKIYVCKGVIGARMRVSWSVMVLVRWKPFLTLVSKCMPAWGGGCKGLGI